MSYKKRTRGLYSPKDTKPFKLSRSKIDLFLECPKCFYMDRRLGVGRPSMPGWSLNSAVDQLLKNEFDNLRKKGHAHDLMKKYKVDAIPFQHHDIDIWRSNFTGKQYLHESTNLLIFGAVDDLWINPKGELIVVDYKATSTIKEISLDDEFKKGYKKQLEVYQWIFRKSGFAVSKNGYIVYANAGKQRKSFDGRLEFVLTLHKHIGDGSWIEPTVYAMKKTLDSDNVPKASSDCEHCAYRKTVAAVT